MPILIELYAKGPVQATDVVSFALANGCVLKSFNEIPPLEAAPKKAKAKRKVAEPSVPMASDMCALKASAENPFVEGTDRWRIWEHKVKHVTTKTPVRQVVDDIVNEGNISKDSAQKALAALWAKGRIKVFQ